VISHKEIVKWQDKLVWPAQSQYSNTPQSTLTWLGVGRIGQGMEKRLRFAQGNLYKNLLVGF
jgi:hypothetical protein